MSSSSSVYHLAEINTVNHAVVCYNNNLTRPDALWRAENPVSTTLPFFALQLCLIIFFSRVLIFFLKPLRQPPIIAEILAGVILGPTGLGLDTFFSKHVFAYRSLVALETIGNLSLVFYIFLVGLELDITPILRASKKAISIAVVGFLISFPMGFGLHCLLTIDQKKLPGREAKYGAFFWAIALATTNFPDLTRILSDGKLLHSEIGKTALSATIITDLCSWVLLVVVMSVTNTGKFYAVFSTIVIVCIFLFVLRPALKWIMRGSNKDGGSYGDFHICFVMTGALACGLVTDAFGSHSIVGAFMWGVIMPKGELREMILAKVEDLVKSVLMPTFFLVIGLTADLRLICIESDWFTVSLVVLLACSAKFVSTFLVAVFCNMPPTEGLALGSLMNTKGLLALIIIAVGWDLKALGNLSFVVMLLSFWVMTALIGPILACMYDSIKSSGKNKYRTIQSCKGGAELRVVACVHSTRHVGGVTHLLGASCPTKQSPMLVYAMHLVELTGRATAMLIVHGQCKASTGKAQTDHVINAFDNFESQCEGDSVTVHSLTAVSPYATMHDDICGIAAEKHVHLIIVPFHKTPTVDGGMEDENPSVGIVNNNVMVNALCSVGILVDRGLAANCLIDANHSGRLLQRYAVFFIGGPDDREALAYACRMSAHPNIAITVVRFLPGNEVREINIADFPGEENVEIMTAIASAEKEKLKDTEYIQKFKAEVMNYPSITYVERTVNNGDETLKAIRNMDNEYNLFIVGRGRGMISPLVSGLSEWSESGELGALGDALATSSFAANTSVLVMQQGDMEDEEKVYHKALHENSTYVAEQFGRQSMVVREGEEQRGFQSNYQTKL